MRVFKSCALVALTVACVLAAGCTQERPRREMTPEERQEFLRRAQEGSGTRPAEPQPQETDERSSSGSDATSETTPRGGGSVEHHETSRAEADDAGPQSSGDVDREIATPHDDSPGGAD